MSIITNIQSINWFHMRTQLSALELELKGIRSSRGSMYAHVKRAYKLRGNRQQVYDQFAQMVEGAKPQ